MPPHPRTTNTLTDSNSPSPLPPSPLPPLPNSPPPQDITEIRTVKRLFGDGDVVFTLRDGAKFEMRNVPNFDLAIDYIVGLVDEDVRGEYGRKGDVGQPGGGPQ